MTNSFDIGKPKISVLMSCYNADRWLSEAIESVLSQSFKDFEFILVDDGSTDETKNIIKSYQAKDSRIVTITKKNTGLADSLNVGIASARGDWIARLDADDLCEITRLEEQISFVRKHPDVVLLGTGFLEIDEHGRAIRKHICPTRHQTLVRHLEKLQCFFPHSTAFYRADMVRQIGGYNGRFLRSQDKRLWLEMSLLGEIACLPKVLVRNRKHAEQMSHHDNGRRQLYDGTLTIICHFLKKAGYRDPSSELDSANWAIFLEWAEKKNG